jgi:uncharacterized damage-inducible protein DinB
LAITFAGRAAKPYRMKEFWQSGPVEGIPALLQPVAHALLQARKEAEDLMTDFPVHLLWARPAGLASPAFHLQHLTGVLDRMLTYAKAEGLNERQFSQLKKEGVEDRGLTVQMLVADFSRQVEVFLEELRRTDPETLTDHRGIGRAQLPSTVLGLLFHAAEHTMRHIGQLLVTVKVLQAASHKPQAPGFRQD